MKDENNRMNKVRLVGSKNWFNSLKVFLFSRQLNYRTTKNVFSFRIISKQYNHKGYVYLHTAVCSLALKAKKNVVTQRLSNYGIPNVNTMHG